MTSINKTSINKTSINKTSGEKASIQNYSPQIAQLESRDSRPWATVNLPPEPLPTMYDLPSEDPEEPGLPDEFHDLQPQLLSRSLRLQHYSRQETFSVSDMNLYYNPKRLKWYKRPDWFLVVGVSRLYHNQDLRHSYVLWDEQVSPILVVEFLSPGTEDEDLGRFSGNPPAPIEPDRPPHKFEVYEKIVQVQNYIVYDQPTTTLRYFRLVNGAYQEQAIAPTNPRLWIPELEIGLAICDDEFDELPGPWLRWFDSDGTILPTDTEVAQQREFNLQQQAQQTIKNLLAMGMSPQQVTEITGVSVAQVLALQDEKSNEL
jgi:Uma2 family endonuclease